LISLFVQFALFAQIRLIAQACLFINHLLNLLKAQNFFR
jgi:hypothetical protein